MLKRTAGLIILKKEKRKVCILELFIATLFRLDLKTKPAFALLKKSSLSKKWRIKRGR